METAGIKALALKVLQRNRQGNKVENEGKSSGNFEGKNRVESFPTKTTGKVVPFNTLSKLLLDALVRVDWQEGVIQAPQVQEAEDNLERAWREAEEGRISLDSFKEILSKWHEVANAVRGGLTGSTVAKANKVKESK
jgi:hypothetical protein